VRRCTARYDESERQCASSFQTCMRPGQSAGARGSSSSAGTMRGSTKSGQDGCYFDQCEPPTSDSDTSQTPPAPTPRSAPSGGSRPTQPSMQMTNICQTPGFWCVVPGYGPVGTSCWCNDMYGRPWTGVAVPAR
jgi:hypothetical protein